MPERFDRDLTVTIGDKVLRARQEPEFVRDSSGKTIQKPGQSREILRAIFKVELSNKHEPNQCSLSVYNLGPDSRQLIEDNGADVSIVAGYTGATSEIFAGDLSVGFNEKIGPDWVTTLESGDGGKQARQGRISIKLAKGAKLEDVMSQLADSMGLSIGNIKEKIREGGLRGAFESFKTSRVLQGKSYNEMRQLARAMGFEVSIQKKQLQLLRPGEATNLPAAIVDSSTGLVGSPERGDKGIVKFTTLIRPQIQPGRRIRLTSAALDGDYVCQNIVHDGDTHGQRWYSTMEVKRL